MPHTVRIKVEKSNNGVSAKGAGKEKQWCDIASVSGQAWWYKPVVVVRWRCESNVAVW
ncbi:hypothetical protein DY000_02046765 [Brassica cretica]|uniref:Uncharacterized protein n=1 Tax=Brassica cretica TaxID=69181 RepID=A0ABQ7F2J6_BRACR|nr:hypothetical protein DY000_02046765 [Brassica cretica]